LFLIHRHFPFLFGLFFLPFCFFFQTASFTFFSICIFVSFSHLPLEMLSLVQYRTALNKGKWQDPSLCSHMLLFTIRYVILNINRLEFDKHMACFVTSTRVPLYTTTFLRCELRRQHISSSLMGLAPVLCYFSRAPSLIKRLGTSLVLANLGNVSPSLV
jgi:hypothetical protein